MYTVHVFHAGLLHLGGDKSTVSIAANVFTVIAHLRGHIRRSLHAGDAWLGAISNQGRLFGRHLC